MLVDKYSTGFWGKNKDLQGSKLNFHVAWHQDDCLTEFYVTSDGWAELGDWEATELGRRRITPKHLLVGATACAGLVRAGAVLEEAETGAQIPYQAIAETLVGDVQNKTSAEKVIKEMASQHFIIPEELREAVASVG